jgi:hypothetical protein
MGVDRSLPSEQVLSLFILGLRVLIKYSDLELRQLLVANFGAMASPDADLLPDLEFSVQRGAAPRSFSLMRRGGAARDVQNSSDLLYFLDKEMTLELQRRRGDLLFLHSAALAWQGKAYLLAADSGAGKSTTTWALLHHEFGYLSDELSPIDIRSLQVFPYPHAVCFKRPPPQPYPLSGGAIHLGRTIHVPVQALPSQTIPQPLPLGGVFLLSYRPHLAAPALRAIGHAEASARLYVTALNALAHANKGLDAVVRIVENAPCFAVSSGGLQETCNLIRATLKQTADTSRA